ncbi:MAG: hypothetical protein H7Y31_02695 [Chitinophagaceae bacterium]|nr:hypothetical protein [Chitinophagaceae bacterium]
MRLLFFFLCIMAANNLFCQPPGGSNTQFHVRPYLLFDKTIDKHFSSVPATGFIPGLQLAASQERNNLLLEVSMRYGKGTLSFSEKKQLRISKSLLTATASILYKLNRREETGSDLHAGLMIDFVRADKEYSDLINFNTSFETIASTSLVGDYMIKIGSNRPVSFRNRAFIAILSMYRQPVFGSSVASDSWSVGSIGEVNKWGDRFSVCKAITERLNLGLGYTWEYYRLNSERETISSMHSLSIEILFKL